MITEPITSADGAQPLQFAFVAQRRATTEKL